MGSVIYVFLFLLYRMDDINKLLFIQVIFHPKIDKAGHFVASLHNSSLSFLWLLANELYI